MKIQNQKIENFIFKLESGCTMSRPKFAVAIDLMQILTACETIQENY